MCFAFCLPPLIQVAWLLSGCIPGPKTISPTQPVGGSDRFVLTIFASPVSLFSIGGSASGGSRVAIHFDVDVVDSNEIVLGLGAEPDGLTSHQVRRLVADVSAVVDVVGLTIAEFVPRQVIRLQQLVRNFPLI